MGFSSKIGYRSLCAAAVLLALMASACGGGSHGTFAGDARTKQLIITGIIVNEFGEPVIASINDEVITDDGGTFELAVPFPAEAAVLLIVDTGMWVDSVSIPVAEDAEEIALLLLADSETRTVEVIDPPEQSGLPQPEPEVSAPSPSPEITPDTPDPGGEGEEEGKDQPEKSDPLAPAPPPPPPSAPATVILEGRVVDRDGKAVSDASINNIPVGSDGTFILPVRRTNIKVAVIFVRIGRREWTIRIRTPRVVTSISDLLIWFDGNLGAVLDGREPTYHSDRPPTADTL